MAISENMMHFNFMILYESYLSHNLLQILFGKYGKGVDALDYVEATDESTIFNQLELFF